MTALDGELTTERLTALLDQHWGIDATTIFKLGGELDASHRIVASNGAVYCMKTRRGNDDDGSVALEIAALEHVGTTQPDLVPTVVTAKGSERSFFADGNTFWLLNWIDGELWSELHRPSPTLQHQLGQTARRLSTALAGFEHRSAARTHHWDLRVLDQSISQHLDQCQDQQQRRIADKALRHFGERVTPRLDNLPTSVVHQDLNDHNVVLRASSDRPTLAAIDFGDVLETVTISELAVAMAYAMLRSPQPVDAAANVAAGWFDTPPTEDELAVVIPMAFGRLVLNALTWSSRSAKQPEYANARSSHTWSTLLSLADVPIEYIEARLRDACGNAITTPEPPQVTAGEATFGHVPLLDLDPHGDVFDGIDVTDRQAIWDAAVPELPFALAHDCVRFDLGGFPDGSGGPATVQLGIELHLEPEAAVSVPSAGRVVEANADRVIAEHQFGEAHWSYWSGLHETVSAGDTLEAGQQLGTASTAGPLRVQLLRFAPTPTELVPHAVRAVDRDAWRQLSIDPSSFLGLEAAPAPLYAADEEVTALRNSRLASSQRYYYDEPMNLVRASGVTFVDSYAHHYLDVINNVTHVGHGNAHVVDAASRQMRRLNTNSRFVYEEMGRYADRLVERFPDPLEVVFLVCTGSEANDLAVRIARQVTGRTNVMVVGGAYHGNTSVVTGISPNRYRGPGGNGPPPTTHEVEQPNRYRGPYGYDDLDAGVRYSNDVGYVATRLTDAGDPPAAFIAESLMGTAGQIVYPDGYLAGAFDHVRAAGGICISDEVQVGFGRLGHTFWGFELGGVVPDIVTMGKPMGNGHPIAAVVTTRAIADAFDQGMKYFNTFGGNPVSCAVANAVLDEIDARGLQAHANDVGTYFLERLKSLQERHQCIGDVRGEGLYLGVEFVLDRENKAPARHMTTQICERLRERGVIMYPNGELGNCLKIKPPMVFDRADVDYFVSMLELSLTELA